MRIYWVVFATILFLVSFTSVSALSVAVHVPEKYADVLAGERFYFEVDVKYPENQDRKDLRLEYEILNEEGDLVAQSKVLKAIETQASFIDFIVIPENADSGLYLIKVIIRDYDLLSEEVEASFHVIGGDEKIRLYFLILLGVIIFVGALVVVNIVLSRRRQ
ncbi:hypothetical protein HOD29_05890 [archaeon]|jgi:hypothetical protein|nr:hypothetical protein [archaeon]